MRKYRLQKKKKDNYPEPDLASCEDCEWSGSVDDCTQEEEGNWEMGYYVVDCCPKCGGPVEYDWSKDPEEKD